MPQTATVALAPRLDRGSAAEALADVEQALAKDQTEGRPLVLDLSAVDHFDSAGMAVLVQGMHAARRRGLEVQLQGASKEVQEFFSLVSLNKLTAPPAESPAKVSPIARIGDAVEPLLELLQGLGAAALEALVGIFVWPFRGKPLRMDRLSLELEKAFLGACPIVLLIGFLLGLILAMQAYVQLRVFGAAIMMADMVGVSVVYEIGPLMTGIILAARSGSSNAAQLGTMVVSEEIDALKQMGIDPVRFLVLPKVLALSFTVVALSLVFAVVAMVGGALFGYLAADIEVSVYMDRTAEAIALPSFLTSCIKCVVFGALVGVVGCGLGLRVKGGSEGVGRATTNAVVLGIFFIIVIDAIFVAVQQLWPA